MAFPGLTVASVSFTGQVDTTVRRLTAALAADGKLKLPAGEKSIKLKVSLDSGDPQAGSIQVLTALAVNDFAPAGAGVPGIGTLTFKDLTLTTTSVAGTVTFRKEDTTVVAWTPAGGGDRRFALVHDKLKIGTYVQAAAGTSLGDLELDQTALIYVPKGGAQKGLTATELPPRLVAALGGKDSTTFPLDLAEGVNVSTLAKLPTAGTLHDLVAGLGITATALPLRGVLDPAYLSAQSPAVDKTGKWPRFTLNLDLPVFRPPGVGDHVAFEKGHVAVVPNKDGKTFDVALATSVTVTLDPAHVLRFTGAFTRASPGVLTFSADATVALTAPFGMQWLTLDELDLACSIDRQKKSVDLAITGQTKIAGKPVKVVTRLIEEQGKLKDVVFGLSGHLPLSVVPGLGGIPGMSGLTVVDPEVSRTHVSGEIDFRKAKIRAAVFQDGADWNLIFENSSFRLDQLLPGLAAGHLGALTFPKMALLVSHKGFTRKASDLPPAITAIMGDLGLKKDDTVEAMAGVNLVTTLDPHTLTGPLRKATDRLGVQQPVILVGAIGGLFGGSPSLTLEAFLPHLPVPQTKFLKMDGKADLKLSLALSPTQLSIGVGTDAHLRIGKDNLVFDASFNLIIQPADVIVDITGKLKGDWHNPMGIRGLVLEGVFLSVGIDVTGAAKVSLGGKAQIGNNEALVEAGTSLQLEAAGIPTGPRVDRPDGAPRPQRPDRRRGFDLPRGHRRPPLVRRRPEGDGRLQGRHSGLRDPRHHPGQIPAPGGGHHDPGRGHRARRHADHQREGGCHHRWLRRPHGHQDRRRGQALRPRTAAPLQGQGRLPDLHGRQAPLRVQWAREAAECGHGPGPRAGRGRLHLPHQGQVRRRRRDRADRSHDQRLLDEEQ